MRTPERPDDTSPVFSPGLVAAIVGAAAGVIVTMALLGRLQWWVVTAGAVLPAVAAWVDRTHARALRRATAPGSIATPSAESVQLRHRALFDPLTGLPNRASLADRMAEASRTARANGTATGVVMVDLDGFKAVNDRLGHRAGDELLVQCAVRLKGVLRNSDTASRPGGDEFVVLCEGLSAEVAQEEMTEVTQRLRAVLATPFTTSAGPARISGSIGVVVVPSGEDVGEHALAEADRRMLEAKRRDAHMRDDPVAAHEPVRPRGEAPVDAQPHAPRPTTVVIVEDDTAMQMLAERILSASGVVVLEQVSVPQEAAAVVLRTRPDLVLCDMMMPGMSGPQVMAAVHATAPDQRFLFWSGVDDHHLHLMAGGHPWITKDRIDGLLDAVVAAV